MSESNGNTMDINTLDGERPGHSYTCEFCANYLGAETCLAYPSGIPIDIWGATKAPRVCNKDNMISRLPK